MIFILFACKDASLWNTYNSQEAFDLLKKTTIQLPSHLELSGLVQMGYGRDTTNGVFLYVLNQSDSSYYSLSETQQVKISLNELLKKEPAGLSRVTPIFLDMQNVLILSKSQNTIYRVSEHNNEVFSFEDVSPTKTVSYEHVIATGVYSASNGGSNFVVRAYKTQVDSDEARKNYFSNPVASLIDIENKTIRSIGEFPDQYQLGTVTVPDFYPQLTFNKEDSIFTIGFKFSHQVHQYKLQSDGTFENFRDHIIPTYQKIIFPEKNIIGNQIETRRFLLSSPAFLNIVYCDLNKVYYRAFLKESNLTAETTNLRGQNRPWCLLVYDKNFNPLKKIEMTDTPYYPYRFFCENGNLLFSTWQNADKDSTSENISIEIHKLKIIL